MAEIYQLKGRDCQSALKNIYIYCLKETHFKYKGRDSLKVKEWRKIYHVNTIKRKLE